MKGLTVNKKWDKYDEENVRHWHKEAIEKTTAGLIGYYSDNNKKSRKVMHLCKFCFYYNTSRIGGCAITRSNCANCGTEMNFENTCTDVFCNKCAEELKLCKHCGQKMEQ